MGNEAQRTATEQIRTTRRGRRRGVAFDEAPGEFEADAARAAFLQRAGPGVETQAASLVAADPGLRARAVHRLQSERGNRHVQRVVAARSGGALTVQRDPDPQAPKFTRYQEIVQSEQGTGRFRKPVKSQPFISSEPKATDDDTQLVGRVGFSYEIESEVNAQQEAQARARRLDNQRYQQGNDEASVIEGLEMADQVEQRLPELYKQIGVSSYEEMMDLRKKLVNRFEEQAYALTLFTLQESEAQANREYSRYGSPDAPGGEVAEFRSALQHLAQVQGALLETLSSGPIEEVVGGGGVPAERLDDFHDNPYPFSVDTPEWRRYLALRQIYGQHFPILLARNMNYVQMSQMEDSALLGFVQERSSDVLKDIFKTREKLEPEKIWNLPPIVERTKKMMGIAPGSGAEKTIQDHQEKLSSDSFWHKIGLGALQIGLGILAAISTGGLSVVFQVGAAAATAYGLHEHVDEYTFQNAARGTSLDPTQVLATEEPSLFWLAVDVVGAVIDAGAALKAFRNLAPAARAVKSLEAGAAKMLTAGTAEATHAEEAAQALRELEEAARAQAQVLKQEGKLPAGMSEELFVERIMATARRQVETAGEAAARRTDLVTQIVDGSHPRMAELIAGDERALQELLTAHGNWKQLVESLQRAGRKDIAQQLQKYRDTIAEDLGDLFGAKPMSGGSTEAVSDIDFFTSGPHAGDDMIAAETYMANKFGADWAETFRMNLYTEGSRLTRYRSALEGLEAAEKAVIQGRLTAQAEKFNFARMLQHAGSDPEAIARVERLAQGVGVNLDELKSLAALDAAARSAKRAGLSREIDALEAEFQTATGARKSELAEQISNKQIEANFYTEEAYIGPGAVEMTVLKGPVGGHEAYQAALSNLEMIEHILAQANGDVALAAREYELYKYINRFTEAASKAGVESKQLTYFEHLSEYVYKSNRQAQEEAAHLWTDPDALSRPGLTDLPQEAGAAAPVTDKFLQEQFDMFRDEAERVLPDLKPSAGGAPEGAAGAAGAAPTPHVTAEPHPTAAPKAARAGKTGRVAADPARVARALPKPVEITDAVSTTHQIKFLPDGRIMRCTDCIELAIHLRQRSARMRRWLEPTSATRQQAADLTDMAKDIQARAQNLGADLAETTGLMEEETIALFQARGGKLLQEGQELERLMAEVEARALAEGRGYYAQVGERFGSYLETQPKLKGMYGHQVKALENRANDIAAVMRDPQMQEAVLEELDKLAKDTRQLGNDLGVTNRRWFDPTAKHQEGGWGTLMDLDDATAETVLNRGVGSTGPQGKQIHSLHDGKIYVFQPDNVGGWHGYPATKVDDLPPIEILRGWRDQKLITNAQYMKFSRGEF